AGASLGPANARFSEADFVSRAHSAIRKAALDGVLCCQRTGASARRVAGNNGLDRGCGGGTKRDSPGATTTYLALPLLSRSSMAQLSQFFHEPRKSGYRAR